MNAEYINNVNEDNINNEVKTEDIILEKTINDIVFSTLQRFTRYYEIRDQYTKFINSLKNYEMLERLNN